MVDNAAQDRHGEAQLLALVARMTQELRPGRPVPAGLSLDSRLLEDLGFDSLGRMELLSRVERAFQISFPDRVLASAERVRDLLPYLAGGSVSALSGLEAQAPTPTLASAGALPLQAENLLQVLHWHCRAQPQTTHILLYGEGETPTPLSYLDLWQGACRVAITLQELEFAPRQTLAIMLPTGRDYLFAFFGALLAGGVPVPIYPPTRPSQIEEHLRRHARILDNAQTPLLLTVPEAQGPARLLQAQVASLRRVLTPAEIGPQFQDLPLPDVAPEDLAFLQYTSGSTGTPKGVELTHANLLANVRAMGQAVGVHPGDVFVSWLPLYHDMGLIGAWLGSLYHGLPLVLMSPLQFLARPERWLRAIHRHRGSLSAAPNFAYELCLQRLSEAQLQGLDLSSWRLAFNGAEPVSPETLRHFSARFAPHGFRAEAMTPVYGLAECSVGLAFPPLGRGPRIDRVERLGLQEQGEARPVSEPGETALELVACGRPLPGHEIRIADPGGEDRPERRVGAIQFRGPSATRGYHRNLEASRALIRGDWLDSGDQGYLADGEVFITGRVKDLIIRAGRNLHPYDAELVVGEIPGVRKGCVAIFGARGKDLAGERLVVMAESKLRDEPGREALKRKIETAISEVLGLPPDEVVLAPPHSVLKTSSGKIRRSACRELYESGAIERKPRALWLQIARLGLAGLRPGLSRLWAWLRRYSYGAYAWSLFTLFALIALGAVALVPGQARRWRLVHHGARWLLSLVRIPVVVGGTPLPAEKTGVLVANHASYLDALVLLAGLADPLAFVAKTELQHYWPLGWFLRRLGCVFVERFQTERSVADAGRLVELARQQRLFLFPEGTFGRRPGLLPFRMGAFVAAVEAGVPIIPLALKGTRLVLRDGSWVPRPGIVQLRFGDPIAATGGDWHAALRLRDVARAFIRAHCGEPDLDLEPVPGLPSGEISRDAAQLVP